MIDRIHRILRKQMPDRGRRALPAHGTIPSPSNIRNSTSKIARPRASALITTLLVLVVLSTIVVAFMQSMSVERSVARSLKNRLTADVAAQAALEAAVAQIRLGVGTNQAFVVGQTNDAAGFGAVLAIGSDNLTNPAQMVPLISGDFALLSGAPTNANPNSVQSFINARTNLATNLSVNVNGPSGRIEVGASTNKYRAPWVYLTNADGTTTSRYSFIVLDELARVNPRYHGAGLTRTNSTNWYPGPGVLPLQTSSNSLMTPAQATALRALNTNTILSPNTLAQAFTNRADYENKKHLLAAFEAPTFDAIPKGYTNGGQPKYNINDLATNTAYGATAKLRAENIAAIINTNLTNFSLRDVGSQLGGLAATNYVNRLAASIVDYIDADTTPTLVNNGEPAGKELAPTVVMVAERNTWVSETPPPAPYTVKIRTEFFVQLWNPYTDVVSGNITLSVNNRQYVELPNGGSQTDFNDYSSSEVAVSLQPNEMRAYKFSQVDQDFVNNIVRPSSASANYPRWPTTSSSGIDLTGHPQFRVLWNGVLLDMNRQQPEMDNPASSGLVRSSPGSNFGPVGVQRISFNFCPPNTPNTVGDGRASYLTSSDWAGLNNIASALWQGRQSDTGGRQQNFSTTWAQRDYVRADIPQGIAMGSLSADPTALSSSYNSTNSATAPGYVRNGAMQSIGELGHIYDPAQVNDTGGSSSGGTPANFYRAAGGRTLRIGQPEFSFGGGASSWDRDGYRAIQLIDLFSVNATNATSGGFPVSYGRININTAPLPILEAIFMNISIASDSAAGGASISSTNATVLAGRVITNRPYSKISDIYRVLPDISSGTNFVTAVPTQTGGGTTNLALMDRGREEVFGKFIELLTTQSRCFRVFVIGQALDERRGKVLSQVAKEAIVSLDSPTAGAVPKIKYLRDE